MPPKRRSKPISGAHACLGEAVTILRGRAALSQEALADRAGLHVTYVSGIERGVRNASFETILRLTQGLGVSLKELMDLVDEMLQSSGHSRDRVIPLPRPAEKDVE